MLGQQLLLQRGVIQGLVSLIRPQHLASLADWEAQPSNAGPLPHSRTVPGLVAAILQEGVLQPQSTALRDLYQLRCIFDSIGIRCVLCSFYHMWSKSCPTVIAGCRPGG